jgi:hypothetical protein
LCQFNSRIMAVYGVRLSSYAGRIIGGIVVVGRCKRGSLRLAIAKSYFAYEV